MYTFGFLIVFLFAFAGKLFAQSPCDSEYRTEHRTNLSDERIDESSGLVASRRDQGLFWTHNDSGDVGRIFGVDSTGETRSIGTLHADGKDFQPYDAEDIAFGPCTLSSKGCLFLADVGDNDEERPAVFVYQFPEPKIGESKVENFVSTQILYPDGAHNVEALLVDPNSMLDGAGPMGYLVEKTKADARVWRVRLAGGKQKAKQVATIKRKKSGILGGLITGGDSAPDGSYIVLRTYESIVVLCEEKSRRSSTKKFVNMFTSSKVRSIIPPDSVQSEAVAIGLTNRIWYTSENTPTPLISMKALPSKQNSASSSCSCSLTRKSQVPLLGILLLFAFFSFVRTKKGPPKKS